MEQSNWDPRLDTGMGSGKKEKGGGKCKVCEVKGDALRLLQHHRATGHAYTYRGTEQVCTDPTCHCGSKEKT